MARYYVCTRSNMDGDDWSPIRGPYATRKVAQEVADEKRYIPERGPYVLMTQVFTRTELRKLGFPATENGENTLYAVVDAACEEEAQLKAMELSDAERKADKEAWEEEVRKAAS